MAWVGAQHPQNIREISLYVLDYIPHDDTFFLTRKTIRQGSIFLTKKQINKVFFTSAHTNCPELGARNIRYGTQLTMAYL